ncbi:MAG: NAD(P)-dependent oxidoreductase [Pseudomonadota bacterium]
MSNQNDGIKGQSGKRHVIIGGDGFVGAQLAQDLVERGADVVVADITNSGHDVYGQARFIEVDVTAPDSLKALGLKADDVVYNMSAKMLSPLQARAKRHDFFWPVNYHGTAHILEAMAAAGAHRLVHFTTDMVYGHALQVPVREDHRAAPLGEYGLSKLESEKLVETYRAKGMAISVFRPRLIIGPGRLGILTKLFKLIDLNLPVPMIGAGRNAYQFISVFDCASAARLAAEAGLPNEAYNLGSDDPPPVRTLLRDLIAHAGSRSLVLPTPAWLVKRTLDGLDLVNMPLMDPEQYLIADEYCVLDTSKAKRDLGWAPQHDDTSMLKSAYDGYRAGRRQTATKADAPIAA